MHAELVNLNHCAVPFLGRAAVSLSWYDSNSKYINFYILLVLQKINKVYLEQNMQ